MTDIEAVIQNNELNKYENRIKRVLFKLAIGHSVYEISEGYCIEDGELDYTFINRMSQKEVDEFLLPFNITEEPLPEMGSRAYDRIMILECNLQEIENPNNKLKAPIILLDWVDVQESKYYYTCYRFGDEIIIKMVLNDYLFAKVVFKTE